MTISDLETSLDEARAAMEKLIEEEASWQEMIAGRQALLQAERILALARGEETALTCKWPILWNTGAPLPHMVSSSDKTYLIYVVDVPDPNWNGTSINVIKTTDTQPIAVVEFLGCYRFHFGGPNDEVFSGHPLWGKGLNAYDAHLVANSRWLAEQEKINAVHSLYNPGRWQTLKHYLLLFHDEIFECLAWDYKVEVVIESMEQVVKMVTERLFARERR
jgi:hypothetical protein